MTHKVTVGLQQKIGQPNFGSVGASCSIEVHLDDEDATQPELLTARIRHAFAQCRDAIEEELGLQDKSSSSVTGFLNQTHQSNDHDSNQERRVNESREETRMASEAQIRALHAIASKSGLSLASELQIHYGVNSPAKLTIREASQLIDQLKQSLTPTPA